MRRSGLELEQQIAVTVEDGVHGLISGGTRITRLPGVLEELELLSRIAKIHRSWQGLLKHVFWLESERKLIAVV